MTRIALPGLVVLSASAFSPFVAGLAVGQELVPPGAEWRYLKGTAAPPAAWSSLSFDDSSWLAGDAGIGYGDGDDATVLDDMENGYLTVYARRDFTADTSAISRLVLRIRYDDGFVAYLNGVEAARRAMGSPGSPVAFDTPADDHEAQGFEDVDLTAQLGALRDGRNVLALEVHNRTLDSSDLSLDPSLVANEDPSCGPYPPGFCIETFASGFSTPTGIAFAPDGRLFVAEKRGMVWIVKDGARLPDPFIDLSGEVNNAGDRGLLGIELDASFAQNGRVYLLYVVDPTAGSPDEAAETVSFGRLVRYAAAGDVAAPASRRVLLGNSAADGFIHCHSSHAIGTVKSARDGSLFVGSGDGGHFDFTDGGQDVTAFDPGCASTFGADDDIGALRSQRLDSFAGKVLRIDPDTGLGLPDNPFFDGDPASVRSRVWVLGLRNPFRFAVRPDSLGAGTLYVGDVGWNVWEEVNVGRGGENFGWPCFEGDAAQGSYQSDGRTRPTCQAVSAAAVTEPLLAWHHSSAGSLGFTGNCVAGACFYTGTRYPQRYRGALFVADYGQSWMRVVDVDPGDELLAVENFATGLQRPVDIEADPLSQDLFYVSIETGEVRRLVYTSANRPPSVSISAFPDSGPAPLEVQLSSAGTFDPDGDPLTYEWSFGDGSALEASAGPVHTYATPGTFTATLTVRDGRGGSTSKSLSIVTAGSPPQVSIASPAAGTRFYGGEQITLRAEASDPEDGPTLDLRWVVLLHHEEHTHPDWFVSTDAEPIFVPQSHGGAEDAFYYEITVTAVDSDGLEASAAVDLRPGELVRGDGNSDGALDISDAVLVVLHLFAGRPAACALALDADASGALDLADAIALLNHLFRDGPAPAAPYPGCGVAPNQAALPCGTTTCGS